MRMSLPMSATRLTTEWRNLIRMAARCGLSRITLETAITDSLAHRSTADGADRLRVGWVIVSNLIRYGGVTR